MTEERTLPVYTLILTAFQHSFTQQLYTNWDWDHTIRSARFWVISSSRYPYDSTPSAFDHGSKCHLGSSRHVFGGTAVGGILSTKINHSNSDFINILDAPISFHLVSQLHIKQSQRSTSVSAHRRCLGIVPKPARSFRIRFPQAFRIRSSRDYFGRRTVWFSSALSFILWPSTGGVGQPSDRFHPRF